MKAGDLVAHSGSLGLLMRKLQWNDQWIEEVNWDGEPAWWVQFIEDSKTLWAYEDELTLVTEGN